MFATLRGEHAEKSSRRRKYTVVVRLTLQPGVEFH